MNGRWVVVHLGELALPYLDRVREELAALQFKDVHTLLTVEGLEGRQGQAWTSGGGDPRWRAVSWLDAAAVLRHVQGT